MMKSKSNNLDSSVNHFDGQFSGVHVKYNRSPFIAARILRHQLDAEPLKRLDTALHVPFADVAYT
jgi:hypothetical protein